MKLKDINDILYDVFGTSVWIENPNPGNMPVDEEVYRELSKEMALQAISFWQNLLLVSSSVVCILISLHNSSHSNLYTRWAYLLAVLFLSLGSLSSGIVLYKQSRLFRNARRALIDEYKDASKQGRRMKRVVFVPKTHSAFLEILAFFLMLLGIFFLVSYAFLKELL